MSDMNIGMIIVAIPLFLAIGLIGFFGSKAAKEHYDANWPTQKNHTR